MIMVGAVDDAEQTKEDVRIKPLPAPGLISTTMSAKPKTQQEQSLQQKYALLQKMQKVLSYLC
jgi:hypothetical protein